ncbi:MAG: hypothetical protein U0516_02620 [Candidatus Saccharibacteria bacterium]
MDTNTVRQPEPFGTDHGVMHELIVTGRSVGADREFYSRLAHDSVLFRQVVNLVNGNNQPAEGDTVTPEQAAQIMGSNFHGIDTLERHLGVKLSAKSKKLFLNVPFSAAVLQACAETHVLVACGALSLMDAWQVQKNLFYAKSDPWYGQPSEQFARSKAGSRLAVGSQGRCRIPPASWDEQCKLLGAGSRCLVLR